MRKKKKLQVLKTPKRTTLHNILPMISEKITEDTLAVGVFVMRKDRTVQCGFSWDAGFAVSDLYGACERLKEDGLETVWGDTK